MKDLFSQHAQQYAAFRPVYPESLYKFLYEHISDTTLAWDAGTGNGQVAHVLAKKFKRVIATDISEAQLHHAAHSENIDYQIAGDQASFIQDKSVELITVAQAIHWFNIPMFMKEVQRVLKPNGWIAVWGYDLISINTEANKILSDFYKNIIGSYWDVERKLIDNHYRTIEFPFAERSVPAMTMNFLWTKEILQGYLTTWSAVQKYQRDKGFNPVKELMERLSIHLSDSFEVSFPIFVRMGKQN